MADVTVYTAGVAVDKVRDAVKSWADSVGFKHYDIEEADEYPGFSVAVDMYLLDEDALERYADQLAEALPFRAATQMDIEAGRADRHLRSV